MTTRKPDAAATYVAIYRFVDVAFRTNDSIFTPDRPIWTRDNRADLYDRFVGNPDESKKSFIEKIQGQMAGAPPDVIQLTAELLYVQLLTPWKVSAKKKMELVETVLAISPNPVSLTDDLTLALAQGLANDMSFNQHRPWHLSFLLEVLREWDNLESARREELLQEPWEFKEFLQDIPHFAAQPMREMLYHFVHPDHFEVISSRKHKRMIVDAFADRLDSSPGDRDRDISAIRRSLEAELGRTFTFYDADIMSQWHSGADDDKSAWELFMRWVSRVCSTATFIENEVAYKREIAAKLHDARVAVLANDESWVSKLKRAFGPPNNLTAWRSHQTYLQWCESNPDAARLALAELWSSEHPEDSQLRAFLDHLLSSVAKGTGVRVALMSFLLTGIDVCQFAMFRPQAFKAAYKLAAYNKAAPGSDAVDIYHRAIRFLDEIVDASSEWDRPIANRVEAQSAVWGIVKWETKPENWTDGEWEALERFRNEEPPPNAPTDPVVEPPPLDELAKELLLEPKFLRDIQHLLEDKHQVIFYGPPGTGKTYVAQKLAACLAGSCNRTKIVQFHPSYTYEDFFEGFRPEILKDQPIFKLHDGPLKRLAKDAHEHPNETFILVIDEINRGNLAKIFGELYFLLEYRDHAIELQYSHDGFSLPENLWIIGTMNTADRSIALIDAALRRRFYFVEFFPDREPIDGLLRRWLEVNSPDMTWVADVVDKANKDLDERHLAIGPSHFMKPDLTTEWVKRIWSHSVLPYLEEHFFGEPDRIEDFTLDKLRGRMQSDADSMPNDSSDTDSTATTLPVTEATDATSDSA